MAKWQSSTWVTSFYDMSGDMGQIPFSMASSGHSTWDAVQMDRLVQQTLPGSG